MREITTENFETEVLRSDKLVLIDFWAPWCMPCRMMAPVLEEFATKHGSEVEVAKVNVDNEPDLARRFNVDGIPCFILFKNGKPVRQTVGYQPLSGLEGLLD